MSVIQKFEKISNTDFLIATAKEFSINFPELYPVLLRLRGISDPLKSTFVKSPRQKLRQLLDLYLREKALKRHIVSISPPKDFTTSKERTVL